MTSEENAEAAGQSGQPSLCDGATTQKYGEGKMNAV